MLAHHPATGQPIRILRTRTQIAKTQTTLIVLTPTMKPSPLYSRYTVVITDAATAAAVVSPVVHIAVLKDDAEGWNSVLPGLLKANPDLLLFASSRVASALTSADRVLVLEDLADAYPWLGEAVNPAANEHILLAVAHLLRFKRILWPWSVERDTWSLPARILYDAWVKHLGGSVHSVGDDDSCIPRTTLIQQYYVPSQGRRHREIRTCLEKNLASPYIDRILLLTEGEGDEKDIPKNDKITSIVLGHRMTYYDAFNAAQDHVGADDFVIISNSDIWFESSLSLLWQIPLKEQSLFLALLRWEDTATGAPHLFGPRADSQDTWIVARKALTFPIVKADLDYPFGQSGCDNAIALDMMRNKLLVVNPAYSIKTMHLHRSNVRTYDPKNILYRPHYLHLEPTAIQSTQVLLQLDGLKSALSAQWKERNLCESFCRPILTTNAAYERTVCKMLAATHQEGTVSFPYVATSQNRFVPPSPSPPLYHVKGGAFVSSSGLVSDWTHMLVGPHRRWATGWEGAQHHLLTQCLQVPAALALPCSAEARTSLSRWVLEYVPTVLAVYGLLLAERQERRGVEGHTVLPEFGAPSLPHIGEFLSYCRWPGLEGKSVQVLPLLDDVQVYASEVWAVPPTDDPVPITREAVGRLRSLLPPTVVDAAAAKAGPCAVLCVRDAADAILTREWAESVTEFILKKGWTVQTLVPTDSFATRAEAYHKADWLIGEGDALDWLWCMREGTTALEFMKAAEPDGSHIHLAGASGIRHIVSVWVQEPVALQRQHALLEVGKALSQFGFAELLETSRSPSGPSASDGSRGGNDSSRVVPVVTLPKGRALSGLYAHSGDTFREMARIWAERGYCRIEESEFTGHCWWGEIGEILLYDRPTLRWFDDSLTYQMALFGNCTPPVTEARLRQSVWSFWPRSPRAIEAVNAKHANLLTYEERTIPSLFLGKIENGVQLAARKTHDWSTAVSLFSMPVDSTGAPYPYTQTEYLEKLCSARFGLSLRGFGPKCNREIEYFACGVVPIVAPDVDMTNYLVPPKAGVHYLVAKTPEDVRTLVAETTAETWAAMSAAGRAWWRSYASAEGLFRLTWARIEQCRPYFTVGIPPTFPT